MNAPARRLSLVRWFAGFALYAAALGAGVWWAGAAGRTDVKDLLSFTLVVSCACQFVPIPIIPLFLWIARAWNPFLVALVGSAATSVANLHDYYILTALLRWDRIGKAKEAAWYRRAAAWFGRYPFWTLAVANVLPLPVDVPRLLAISTRYSRPRFVLATLVGRYPRYLFLSVVGYELQLTNLQILVVLIATVAIAGIKTLHSRLRQKSKTGGAAPLGETQ